MAIDRIRGRPILICTIVVAICAVCLCLNPATITNNAGISNTYVKNFGDNGYSSATAAQMTQLPAAGEGDVTAKVTMRGAINDRTVSCLNIDKGTYCTVKIC